MIDLSTASALGTVAGLIGQFVSSRKDSASAQNVSEGEAFLIWLNEHDHKEVTDSLRNSQESLDYIEAMLEQGAQQLESQLKHLESLLTMVLSADPHMRSLSQSFGLTVLSDQARSILSQFVRSGAIKFYVVTPLNKHVRLLPDGLVHKEFKYNEPRYLQDDLDKLVNAGLVTRTKSDSGHVEFTITRAAVAFCEADIT
jgi:hypothetical protein